MMNVSDRDARGMSLHDYEARLHHWNAAHSTEVQPPDPEKTKKLIDRINADPKLFAGKGAKEPMRAGAQPG